MGTGSDSNFLRQGPNNSKEDSLPWVESVSPARFSKPLSFPKMPVRKANAVLLKIVEDGINKRASKMQLCQYFFLSPHN